MGGEIVKALASLVIDTIDGYDEKYVVGCWGSSYLVQETHGEAAGEKEFAPAPRAKS